MTSKKRNPNEIGAAIGYFSNFFNGLIDALEEVEGKPEMLYFSSREHAKPMMQLLAKTIVESGLWKVPVSFILEEVKNATRNDEFELDLKYNWSYCSSLAQWLTTLRFCPEGTLDDPTLTDGPIPEGLREIIRAGAVKQAGDTLTFTGKKYVVTQMYPTKGTGKITDYLDLAPAEWIDIEN